MNVTTIATISILLCIGTLAIAPLTAADDPVPDVTPRDFDQTPPCVYIDNSSTPPKIVPMTDC